MVGCCLGITHHLIAEYMGTPLLQGYVMPISKPPSTPEYDTVCWITAVHSTVAGHLPLELSVNSTDSSTSGRDSRILAG